MGLVLVAGVDFEVEAKRCHDAVERSDIGEKLGELVVSAHYRHLVPVRIELLTRNHRNWLDRTEVQPDSSRRSGKILEQRRNLVRRWDELAHHVQIPLIL